MARPDDVLDAVIVGGGAMGSAAAWALATRGRNVVLLERFERRHDRGSSHGATRIFRIAYDRALYARRAVEALRLWRELEDATGTQLLDPTGAVDHGQASAVEVRSRTLAECGVSFDLLEPSDAMKRWPGMRFDGPVLLQPDGGRLHAERAITLLQDEAARAGADLRWSEPVVEVAARRGGVRVTTEHSEISARTAIVAAGSWAPKLVGDLPTIRVTQEQPAHFRPTVDAQWPSFIHHRPVEIYGLAEPGVGVKVGEHSTGDVIDPDERDFRVNDERMSRLCDYVRTWLPGLDPEPVATTTCLYDTAPDEDFIIERRGHVVIGTGFSGHGFKFTPLIGTMLADLALGER